MLHRVFGFADLTAGQVMVPRTEMVAVAEDAPMEAVLQAVARGAHDRYPVYRKNLDNIVGMLHLADLVPVLARGGPVDVAALAREAYTVPETMPADTCSARCARAIRRWRSSSTSTAGRLAW